MSDHESLIASLDNAIAVTRRTRERIEELVALRNEDDPPPRPVLTLVKGGDDA